LKGGIFIKEQKIVSDLSDETLFQMYLSIQRHSFIKGLQELEFILKNELAKRKENNTMIKQASNGWLIL
jgi:hypothetical protein